VTHDTAAVTVRLHARHLAQIDRAPGSSRSERLRACLDKLASLDRCVLEPVPVPVPAVRRGRHVPRS